MSALGLMSGLRRVNNLRGFEFRDLGNWRKLRLLYRVAPYTHVRYRRLSNVYELASGIERRNLPGAFVECGVWRGGCAAVMASVAAEARRGRMTWLFDSFEGLPQPTESDGASAMRYAGGLGDGELSSIGRCVGSLDDVKSLFAALALDDERVRFVKGWFQETLPVAAPTLGPIAILRLDGDWYESTRVCLEYLYDSVVGGGFVIVDDYGHWEGCRRAVDEFRSGRGIEAPLQSIDYTGRYWVKP